MPRHAYKFRYGLCALLAHNRVSAVPGNSFYAPNCLRLSYAVKDENIFEAMKRLKEFVLSLD